MIRIYHIGNWIYNDSTIAIPCKDVLDINEARNTVLNIRREWQEEYSDEEYNKIFGKNKVIILEEKTSYIRKIGHWVCSGYEYKEWDWVSYWKETEIFGRGAMKCYIFKCQDLYNEYNIHCTMQKEVQNE